MLVWVTQMGYISYIMQVYESDFGLKFGRHICSGTAKMPAKILDQSHISKYDLARR